MEIVINIYYTGANGCAKRFAQEMMSEGIVKEIRAESGNRQYEYFFPAEDAETVLLIDRWENQEALDRHHASVLMEKIAALREKYSLHMRVERFVVDSEGIPDSDKKFIKV
ncbi:MAG: antibiotic biosynthesis monooxygenase [Bacillota bacterium]|nr:MAG: antibiotic biosynthesis monooxygenase [Bacillota bacterium]